MIVVITKVALAKELDAATLTGFFMALLAYNGKKVSAHLKAGAEHAFKMEEEKNGEAVQKITKELQDLKHNLAMSKLGR